MWWDEIYDPADFKAATIRFIPDWFFRGIENSLGPDAPLLTRSLDWSGDRPRGRFERSKPCYEHRPGGPYYAYPQVYMDLLEDVARLFVNKLPPGGLTYQILGNQPFKALRANCHNYVDDETLKDTVTLIHQNVFVARYGQTYELAGSQYWHRKTEYMDRKAEEQRYLLALGR